MSTVINDDPIMFSGDVQRMLGLSRSTLHRLCKAKVIPAPFKIGLLHNCWKKSAIDAYLLTQQQKAAAK